MVQKKWALLTMSSLSLFMVACDDSENLEEMQEAASEIDRIKNESVDVLNQLVDTENQLQDQFNETMETDEDLTTFGDGSSAVFENIEARETILSQLDEKESEMEAHQELLATYEGELLNQEEIDQVISSVDDFTEHLSLYTDVYASTLDSQSAYFTSLANEETEYEDFVEGIETLNEERDSLREQLADLDGMIVELDDNLTQLQSTIDDLLTEEE